jgi:hypothetical protein
VSTQLELRSASQQLDETRFNHLQAVHDYLVAWTRYEVAVGIRPGTNLPIVPTGADEPLPVPPTGVPPVPPPPAPDASAPISIVPGETP